MVISFGQALWEKPSKKKPTTTFGTALWETAPEGEVATAPPPTPTTTPTTGFLGIPYGMPLGGTAGMQASIEAAQKVQAQKEKIAGAIPLKDEAGQPVTLSLFPTDVGLDENVLKTLFKVKYEGQEIIDWEPLVEGLEPPKLSFSADPTTGNILVISEGREVGQADAKTGDLTLDDKFISSVRNTYIKSYGKEVPVGAWFTGVPAQTKNVIDRFLYSKIVIGGKILPAPAEVLGGVGLVGSLAVVGYQSIPVIKNLVSSATKGVLDIFIKNNAKNILNLVQREGSAQFTKKDQILLNLYKYHGRYITLRAQEIITQQRAGAVVKPTQIPLLESYVKTTTQTTNSVANVVRTGKELTTTSITGLIATGTPVEFTQGITAIIAGQIAPTITGIAPTVTGVTPTITEAPTIAMAEGETISGEIVKIPYDTPAYQVLLRDEISVGELQARIDWGKKQEQSWLNKVSELGETATQQVAIYRKGIDSMESLLPKGVTPEIPTKGKIIPKVTPEVTKPVEVTAPEAPASNAQKAKGHIIASEKALINPKTGKTTQQYRRLAQNIAGKKSMKDMTQAEASAFIEALEKYPERKWSVETGTWIPQSIPLTTAVVPENYFNLKFGEPTPVKYFTSQTYYATKLGVGPLVEPLEIAKQELDLVYPAWGKAIDTKIGELNKAYKVTTAEKLAAFKANKPTRASAEMAQLLNQYEDLPPEVAARLGGEKVKIFSWFRNLSRTMLNGQNQVREILGMPAIPHREAYFSHVADKAAEEIMYGAHPLPSDLAYWSKRVVGKRVFNPRAIQRQLKDDLLDYFSKDLGYVTKSMVNTALKEIYLSQPLKALNAQLNALNKGLMPFDSLTPAELQKASLINPLPASTRKWVVDYVNTVIKGQQTEVDASINRVITQSGIGGVFDKFLKPFGRSVGLKPATKISQFLGRSIIYATVGTKPRQIIRNLQQASQDLAMHGIIPTLKSFLPANKELTRMLNNSLFLKSYAIMEEMPTTGMSKAGRTWMWAYGKSAVFNARKSMKASYHSKGHYITNKADAKYGWADPARTYTEPKGFLYDSEYKKLLKEAEFSSGAAQYQYNPLGMPEIFRHKTLAPLTRLQSWWMNYFFKFHREAFSRFWNGHVGWDPNLKLNWSDRLNWLKYVIIGGAVLTALGYNRSFGRDVLPHWSPPGAQLVTGAYNYIVAGSDYERDKAQRQMFYSLRAFVPGIIDYNFYKDIWSGDKPISNLFFYSEDWPPDMPTWGIPALVAEAELGHRIKRINEDLGEWVDKLGTSIPAEDETESYIYETPDLASDIWAELRDVPEEYRTKEKGFPDIALLYNESQSLWNEHYYSLPESQRREFIQTDDPLSIQVGAYLVLWGRLKATGWAAGNPQTITRVENLMNQYNIPPEAVPSMGGLQEREQGGGLTETAPWETRTPSTPRKSDFSTAPWEK